MESTSQEQVIGVSDEVATEGVSRRLPFTFAKRHGVLVQETPDRKLLALHRPGIGPRVLAELRRFFNRPFELKVVTAEHFDTLLQEAYEAGSSQAMEMMEGLDADTDLFSVAQALPEPSDLLESDDDAPIIRLINAILTQAVKEDASDIHIEPF